MTSVVSVKSGQSVPVVFRILNTDSKPLTLKRTPLDARFDITVTDPSGTKVLSFSEILAKKIREKTATQEKLISSLPVYSGPGNPIIGPKSELRIEYDLGYFYNLTARGKYLVKFRKFAAKGKKDLIGRIEVEIK